MSLPFPTCQRCGGYTIDGTLAHSARGLSSMCRCGEEHRARVLDALCADILDLSEGRQPTRIKAIRENGRQANAR